MNADNAEMCLLWTARLDKKTREVSWNAVPDESESCSVEFSHALLEVDSSSGQQTNIVEIQYSDIDGEEGKAPLCLLKKGHTETVQLRMTTTEDFKLVLKAGDGPVHVLATERRMAMFDDEDDQDDDDEELVESEKNKMGLGMGALMAGGAKGKKTLLEDHDDDEEESSDADAKVPSPPAKKKRMAETPQDTKKEIAKKQTSVVVKENGTKAAVDAKSILKHKKPTAVPSLAPLPAKIPLPEDSDDDDEEEEDDEDDEDDQDEIEDDDDDDEVPTLIKPSKAVKASLPQTKPKADSDDDDEEDDEDDEEDGDDNEDDDDILGGSDDDEEPMEDDDDEDPLGGEDEDESSEGESDDAVTHRAEAAKRKEQEEAALAKGKGKKNKAGKAGGGPQQTPVALSKQQQKEKPMLNGKAKAPGAAPTPTNTPATADSKKSGATPKTPGSAKKKVSLDDVKSDLMKAGPLPKKEEKFINYCKNKYSIEDAKQVKELWQMVQSNKAAK